MTRIQDPVLANHLDEMFRRADVMWDALNQRLPDELKRYFAEGIYAPMLENMYAVYEAVAERESVAA